MVNPLYEKPSTSACRNFPTCGAQLHPSTRSSNALVNMDEFDDLSALPEELRTQSYLAASILKPLCKLRGIVISGKCMFNVWISAEPTPSILLSNGYRLQFRLHPRGLISRGQLAALDTVKRPIMVQSVWTHDEKQDFCTLAVLLPPNSTSNGLSVYDSLHPCGVSVGAKNVHLLPISLFNAHSIVGGAEYSICDNCNFSCCVASVFKTQRPTASGNGSLPISVGGISTFYLALSLSGASVPDDLLKNYQEITWHRWQSFVSALSAKLQNSSGTAVQNMHDAMAITDMTTIEGLIAILSNSYLVQILPDALHRPDSIPLYIAMALRLGMRSDFYSLPKPTPGDVHAINELNFAFESMFTPILTDHQGAKYAIDLCIQRALEEAARASVSHGPDIHLDALKLWGTAGVHAIVQLFGITFDDVLPSTCTFGDSALAGCPIVKAGRKYISSSISPNEISARHNTTLSTIAQLPRQRATCMQILNSVEVWLRQGTYQMLRLSPDNSQPSVNDEDDEDDALAQLVKSDGEQMKQFLNGMIAAAAEHKAGETGEDPKACVEKLVENVTTEMDALTVCVKMGIDSGVNLSAFQDGSNRMGAALCQGTLAVHQMPIATWMAHEEAIITCGSCSAHVPLLVVTMASLPQSSCPFCHRPKCLACQQKQTTRCKCKKARKRGN